MKKQIKPNIKAHLIRSAFYVLLLLAVCVIPFALAQRNTTKRSALKAKGTANLAAAGQLSGARGSVVGISSARDATGKPGTHFSNGANNLRERKAARKMTSVTSTRGDSALSHVPAGAPKQQGKTRPAQPLGIIDCDNQPGIVIHDDGSIENGYSGASGLVTQVIFADKFTPSEYPNSYTSVCLDFVTLAGGPATYNVDIVVYDDDGPGGSPGTLLGTLPAQSVTTQLFVGGGQPPIWNSFDISSLGINITDGSVYIGAQWVPPAPTNVYISADESTTHPVGFAGGYWFNDLDAVWAPIQNAFAGYRSCMIRAVQLNGAPTPTPTPPPGGCQYTIAGGTDPIVPGDTDTGLHTDDGDTFVALPFPFSFCGQSFDGVNVNSNGRLDFVCVNEPVGYQTACLPAPPNQCPYDYTIFPVWEDQRTDIGLSGCASFPDGNCGVFTSVSGSAPNRIFNIEWRTVLFNDNNATQNYEARLYENEPGKFDVVIGTLNVANADHPWVSGVQGANNDFTQDFCITPPDGPPSNVSRSYTSSGGGTPTPTPTCPPGSPKGAGAWTAGNPYPTTIVRYGFAQTATHFYVIGGVDNGATTNAVNRMDLATGNWESRAPSPFSGEAPTCSLDEGAGIIYCTDGTDSNGFAAYDIASDTWTPLASDPFTTDHYGSASGVFNGKVFVAGGFANGAGVDVYDIASNTWSAGTAAPTTFWLAGYHQIGQFLYVVGGFDPNGPNNNPTTWRLDMSSAPGVWETGPAFIPQLADFGLAYDPATNKLYSLGGDLPNDGNFFNSTNQVNELDLSAWPGGTWNPSPPDLPLPNRQANQAGFYGNGDIWSVGGLVGSTFQFLPEVWHRNNSGGGCTPTPSPTPTPTPGGSCPPTITESSSQEIVDGDSVACGPGSETHYWRAFDMNTFTGGQEYDITSVEFGIELAQSLSGTGQPVTVNLYTNNGAPFPGGTRTLLATSGPINVPDQADTILNVPITATVPAGTLDLVMEVVVSVNGDVFLIGANPDPETRTSYISSDPCGTPDPVPVADIGFPDVHYVINIHGSCPGGTPTPSPTVTPSSPPITPTPPPSATPTPTVTPTITPPPSATPSATVIIRPTPTPRPRPTPYPRPTP